MSLKIATKTTVWFLILAGAVLLFDFIATMHGLLFVAAITAVISGWLLLYQIVAGIELRRPMVRPVVFTIKKSRRPTPSMPQIATATQPATVEKPSTHSIAPAPVKADAISVLCNLGYTKSDARRSVAMVQIENPHAELDELVRNALALLVSPLVVNQSAAVN